MAPRRLLFALPTLVLGLGACGGTATLTAEEVATKAEDALEEEVGARPDVTCPDSLEVQVGAETRCTLTAEGLQDEYGVTVTVDTVDGDKYGLDVQVDQEPVGGGQ